MTPEEIKTFDFPRLYREVRVRIGIIESIAKSEDDRVLEEFVQPLIYKLVEFCMCIEPDERYAEDLPGGQMISMMDGLNATRSDEAIKPNSEAGFVDGGAS